MFILLDIDGVMVTAGSWKRPEILNDGFFEFSNKAVQAIQKIISETSATILLTSSHKSTYSISQWKNIFSSRGINTKIDKLEDNLTFLNRKDEILRWYQNQNNIEDFIIIDDDKSLNGLPQQLKDKLILTSATVGLNDELADEAIMLLNHHPISF